MVSVGELFRLPTIDRLAGDRAPRTWAASNPASRAAALDARDCRYRVLLREDKRRKKRKNSGVSVSQVRPKAPSIVVSGLSVCSGCGYTE